MDNRSNIPDFTGHSFYVAMEKDFATMLMVDSVYCNDCLLFWHIFSVGAQFCLGENARGLGNDGRDAGIGNYGDLSKPDNCNLDIVDKLHESYT